MTRWRPCCRAASLCALLAIFGTGGTTPWVVYENCKVLENPANDGDSFHVSAGGRDYLFRLYFVDTPETGSLFPDRIRKQADYFGIEEDAVRDYGKQATLCTRQFLKNGFTVYTRMQDARGMSEQKRYFALVRVGQQDLGEVLVKKGLARVYGEGTALPDGRASRRQWAALHKLEKTARGLRRGAWKNSRAR